jgi:hypothetical protein
MILTKNIFVVLISATLLFAACVKEETPKVTHDAFVPTNSDSLIRSGSFMSNDHPTSGTVEVYTNGTEQTISFKNFKGDNGPDLRVYISTSLSDNDFIELGELAAVSGDFSYKTQSATDLNKYRNVLIWCQDFSVLFGHAVLQ